MRRQRCPSLLLLLGHELLDRASHFLPCKEVLVLDHLSQPLPLLVMHFPLTSVVVGVDRLQSFLLPAVRLVERLQLLLHQVLDRPWPQPVL